MADDWIIMRKELPTDPRVIRIGNATKKPPAFVCGCLLMVWSVADSHAVEGRLDGYTIDSIDTLTGVKGFGVAMRDHTDWLTQYQGGIELPNFERYNGESAKTRADAANRQRLSRKKRDKSVTVSQNSVTLSQKCHTKTVTTEQNNTEQNNTEQKSNTEINTPLPPASGGTAAKPPGWGATFSGLIYNACWKKQDRAAALKAIDKAGREITTRHGGNGAAAFEWLLDRVKTFAASRLVATSPPQFVKAPASWFNAGSYDDDDEIWKREYIDGQRNGHGSHGGTRTTAGGAGTAADIRAAKAAREWPEPASGIESLVYRAVTEPRGGGGTTSPPQGNSGVGPGGAPPAASHEPRSRSGVAG